MSRMSSPKSWGHRAGIATALSLVVVASCTELPERDALGPEIAFSHKPGHSGGNGGGGGPGGDTDPLVDVTVDPGLAISDDGSAYVSGVCGVEGEIWEGGSEDVTMTPGKNWKANLGCPKRFFVVDLTDGEDENGDPVSFGPAGTLTSMTIMDLNQEATTEGVWVQVPAQFLGHECDRLRYDSGTLPGSHVNPRAPWTSQDVWATRVAHFADPAKRAWRVQTLNPNTGVEEATASCINPVKGRNHFDGSFTAPFSVLIEEQ